MDYLRRMTRDARQGLSCYHAKNGLRVCGEALMRDFHQLEERDWSSRRGEARLAPGQAAAVITGLSALSWAVLALVSAVYALL